MIKDYDLERLVDNKRDKCGYRKGYTPSDAQVLGKLIASHFEWDGKAIMMTMLEAFEDSNFHTLNEQLKKVWEQQS